MATPKLQYFIILSNRPGYTVIDRSKCQKFVDLKKEELAGTLPAPKVPTARARAEAYVPKALILEDYIDEEDGKDKTRYHEELVVAQGDEEGRIFIPHTDQVLARRVYRNLKKLDKTVKFDPAGYQLPEIVKEAEDNKVVNRGGRPRKQ